VADYSVTFLESGTLDTSRVASPAIWGDCNWLDIERMEPSRLGQGYKHGDDFVDLPLAPTLTTQIAFGRYKAFATSGETISGVSSVNSVLTPGGIVQFTVGSSANSASMALAYPCFAITGDSSTSDKLWFECRLAISSIVASRLGFFVGLAETQLFTLATGVPFSSNTGAAITNGGAMIGFNKTAANTTTASTVRSDRATSFTAIGSGEVGGTGTNALAAYTFVKLGMKYDPRDKDGRNVRFFADNYELPTALKNSDITGTTNLKAGGLNFLIATVGGSAVSSDATFLDWVRIAQRVPA
jgi:hypothetical protein